MFREEKRREICPFFLLLKRDLRILRDFCILRDLWAMRDLSTMRDLWIIRDLWMRDLLDIERSLDIIRDYLCKINKAIHVNQKSTAQEVITMLNRRTKLKN